MPGIAGIAGGEDFAGVGAEIDAGRIEIVRRHAFAEHAAKSVLPRQPVAEGLPRFAGIARPGSTCQMRSSFRPESAAKAGPCRALVHVVPRSSLKTISEPNHASFEVAKIRPERGSRTA